MNGLTQSLKCEDAATKQPPWVTILTPPNPNSKTGGRCIVLAVRGYRSKWWKLECFCKRARKDGTCKTLDQLVPLLSHPERVRFEHVAK